MKVLVQIYRRYLELKMLYLIPQAGFQIISRNNWILELLGIYINGMKHINREINPIRLYYNITLTSAEITIY